MSGPEPERPPGYEDDEWEAYVAGFTEAMKIVASAASAFAARGPGPESAPGGEAEDDGRCGECGAEKLEGLGTDGKVCPVCDL